MTIDEAINILKQYVDYDNPDVPDFYTMEEAIKVIIEALEQEPMRDATSEELKSVNDYIKSISKPTGVKFDFDEEQEQIDFVQPHRTVGKLISVDVLDKIRAEIEEQVLESLSDGGDDWFTAEKVNECLEIIDKYRAETE